jgi:hypothetical protein
LYLILAVFICSLHRYYHQCLLLVQRILLLLHDAYDLSLSFYCHQLLVMVFYSAAVVVSEVQALACQVGFGQEGLTLLEA